MAEVKFSSEKPPIYERAKDFFGVDWDKGVIFTYGDTIHCKFQITPDLVEHEKVHIEQQKELGPEKWWDRYLSYEDFRYHQEIEAYRAQYKFCKEHIKDRNRLNQRLLMMAGDLCHMYKLGNLFITDATKIIKNE